MSMKLSDTFTDIAAALCLGIALSGCSHAPIVIAENYTPPPKHPSMHQDWDPGTLLPPPPQTCGVYVREVRDLRHANERNLGDVDGHPVYGDDIVNWLNTGIETFDTHGFLIYRQSHGITSDPAHANVEVGIGLLKAYMESIETSKVAMMVVKVTFNRRQTKNSVTRIYRGIDTSIDWLNTVPQINMAFERATEQVLSRIQSDLHDYCSPDSDKPSSGEGVKTGQDWNRRRYR